MNDFGLYVIITNPTLPYEQIATICVEEKIRMLQLRLKDSSDRELLAAARQIAAITKGSETNFFLNDRADLAIFSEADGLHVGQDDAPLSLVRSIMPPNKLLGLSTHSLEQAQLAWLQQPDYIGFGPIYPTPTKKHPDPTVGTTLLRQVVTTSPCPVVAIGGIDETNIDAVLDTGARNIAVVRYLMQTTQLRDRIRLLQDKIARRLS